ncbi:MAG TPA: GNAT family N-acetyltransferase [Casimicrobiaceae bacterium]|jgi:ribosomal-protein-alanine N-acetyltransferase|nr:GNAT family N-acetyltransferase [Casimicrobiaceae bacterium]
MNATAITLRLARRSEAPALALMSRDLVEAGLGWHYRADRIRQLIDDVDSVALAACDGQRVAGFAIMSFGDEHAHLVLLAVRTTHQRRGIARRMTEWLLESAATAGIASIKVELRTDNIAAYQLYRGLGFVEMMRAPGYYRGRETAIFMMRMLRPPGLTVQTWRPPTLDRR